MVRKRSYKKYTEVSDESDSDDFYEENTSEEAQPKKYSLRQRRGTNFAEDFDYELVEEADVNVGATTTGETVKSEDEDFDVEGAESEIAEETANCKPRTSRPSTKPASKRNEEAANIANCTITTYKERELEPEIPKDKQSCDDMIDFEDVIRADILVNKSRIDYDSIIEKTEIKLEKTNTQKAAKVVKPEKVVKLKQVQKPGKLKKNTGPPKKRGRKPKRDIELEDCYESMSHESQNSGLPINTVLGVTESLYELAERYHMQGGIMPEAMESIPAPESLLKDGFALEMTENGFIENENDGVHIQEPDTVSEAIETF